MTIQSQNGAFTLNEFMAFARIGRTKTYQEINNGRLKVRRIGRKNLILRKDAEEWLNSLPEAG